MGEALRSIVSEPEHSVEIVVHISETLGEVGRCNLVTALEQDNAIVSAEFCPLRDHLILVRYDRDNYSSQDVLGSVNSQNVNARLIGPV